MLSPGNSNLRFLSSSADLDHDTVSVSRPKHNKKSTKAADNRKTNKTDHSAVKRRRDELRHRRKARKQQKRQQNVVTNWKRHSRQDFQTFFDTLVSDNALTRVATVIKLLQEKLQRAQSKKHQAEAVPLTTVLLDMLNSTKTSQARLAVLEFLLSTTKQRYKKRTEQEKLADEAIEVFVSARQRGLENSLFWCLHDATKISSMSNKARSKLQGSRKKQHDRKSEETLRNDAEELCIFLHRTLPNKMYRQVVELFKNYIGQSGDQSVEGDGQKSNVDSDTGKMKTKDESFIKRTLSGHLKGRTSHYHHLIAPQIVDFFYMNQGLGYDVTEKDNHFQESKQQYEYSKSSFVEAMIQVQNEVLGHTDEEDRENSSTKTSPNTASSVVDIDTELDLNITPHTFSQSYHKKDLRFRKPSHMTFEALQLQESAAVERSEGSSLSNFSELAERIVFVDNLPIDVTAEQLDELYSRCGKIESIKIYNQRPDLDPGPLSMSKLMARRKKQRMALKHRRWERPRTPVYAQLTFQEKSTCEQALDDSLRVFGMVIQKHPARSIRPSDMTRLYLENIPAGIPCLDVEYHLSRKLQPGLFVCLDSGQNNKAIVGSCEIKFPSFELALESFDKLKDLEFVHSSLVTATTAEEEETTESTCLVNWMRTPKNARKWYTRAIGFE